MPDTTPTPAPKRTRAPRRLAVRFLYLEPGDQFFIGRCRYMKSGFFRAVTVSFPARTITLPPWRKVLVERPQESELEKLMRQDSERVYEQVSEVVAGVSPFVGLMDRAPFPVNQGQTHFVGDDCPGGHADKPVNNDNNIVGPTS